MKIIKILSIVGMAFLLLLIGSTDLLAQCSICSKVAADLGEGAARGLNAGILYLLAFPVSFIGIAGYKWYKNTMDRFSDEE